jgi:tetratricopeptide (TPR) repeat protein
LLFAAVLAFYSSISHNRFIGYDDPDYILDNPHVKAGLSWKTLEWAFLTNTAANWHPLTWLSHALDCDLFDLNPAGPHWENVLLHALNAVLLFWLLQSATRHRWRSLLVAALFALHPINVESVAWAAERKNVLSLFFFLLALYSYVWYTRKPAPSRYLAVFGFFLLALLAKPQVIAFPFLLLLFDDWPLNRYVSSLHPTPPRKKPVPLSSTPRFLQLAWEKVPLFLLAAASAIVTMLAQSSGGAVKDLARIGLPLRLETSVVSYLRYLGKAFWPARLVGLYPHPTQLYPAWQVAAAIFLLLLITAAACARFRQQPYLAVGWFWFLGSLVPMIGLVQVGEQALADRYAYLSFIGLFLASVWLLADLSPSLRVPPRWLAVPSVGCALLLGTLTYRQVTYWQDTETFWRRALALTSNNYIAERNLAALLHSQSRNDEASQHLRSALAIRPDDLLSNLYFAADQRSRGDLPSAIEHYQLVAQRATRPRLLAQANTELAAIYGQLGNLSQAKLHFQTSLQLVPNQPSVMISLGLIAFHSGDLDQAAIQFHAASQLQPTDVNQLLLAQTLQLQGHSNQAAAIVTRLQRLSPNFAAAQKTASSLLAEP